MLEIAIEPNVNLGFKLSPVRSQCVKVRYTFHFYDAADW